MMNFGNKFPHILDHLADTQNGDDTALYLTTSEMELIYKSTLYAIFEFIRSMISLVRLNNNVVLFLAGEGLDSYISHHIHDEFHTDVYEIVIPDRPSVSVLFGTTLFGLV